VNWLVVESSLIGQNRLEQPCYHQFDAFLQEAKISYFLVEHMEQRITFQ
jgi:hypothetical protein